MDSTYIFGNIGTTNTQVGTNTLVNLTTGLRNTAFGENALRFLTTGDDNSAFGSDVASSASGNPSACSGFGAEAIRDITTATDVDAFGYQALANLTTGVASVAFGAGAGDTIITGSDNAFIGSNSDAISSIVFRSVAFGFNTVTASNCTVIGSNTQVTSGSAEPRNVFIGLDIIPSALTEESVIIGNRSGSGGVTTFESVLVGHDIANGAPPADVNYSVIIGNDAMENIKDSLQDVVIGYQAGQDVDYSECNVFVGVRANQSPIPTPTLGSPLRHVVAYGYEAGINNSSDGNVMVGSYAAHENTTGAELACCGFETLRYITGGSRNTAVGYQAMRGVSGLSIGASENIAFGTFAMTNITTGSCNIAFGSESGATITSENRNILVGYLADITAGVEDAIVFGQEAVAAANDSIVFGYNSRCEVVGGIAIGANSQLTLANSDTPGSCLFGDSINNPSDGIMRFRAQDIIQAAWVSEDPSDLNIDDEGNIILGTASAVSGTSVGATPLTLKTISIPLGTAKQIETTLVGHRTDGGGLNDTFVVRVDGVVRNDEVTVDVFKIEDIQLKDDPAWTVDYVITGAIPASADIEIQVTGVVGSSINWDAEVRIITV